MDSSDDREGLTSNGGRSNRQRWALPVKVEFVDDAASLLDLAGPSLARREVENSMLLGAALRCRREQPSDAVMAVVRDGADVALVAIMTPPHALVLSAGDPEANPYLVGALGTTGIRPPGVFGVEPLAERFAALWRARSAAEARPESRILLYRASSITPPPSVPGVLREATADDVDWLAAWQRRFARQAGLGIAERTMDMRAVVAARIARGEMVFWSVAGRPVASAAFVPTTPAGDAGRINAVFTLEGERGKGYASACVAALSRRVLARGWRYCLLFADRRNPTTTHIYPCLGYEAVAAFTRIGFHYEE
jgi:predicted GNAT family acetyltransferase